MKNSSKSLLILAHGSRLASANEEFFAVVERLANEQHDYDLVLPCFLEMAAPTLFDVSKTACEAGCDSADVYPLFFNCGTHVGKDIPALVGNAMDAFPQMQFRLLNYFGSNDALANDMLRHIQSQDQPSQRSISS